LAFSRPDFNRASHAGAAGRLSISGIQPKMSLVLRNRRLEMTEAGGQFILKPAPHGSFRHLDMVPINEHVTMQIARQIFNMAVAANGLVEFGNGDIAYLVRRFDVHSDGSHFLQEDFAQIANRSEEAHGQNYKYDLSYEDIGLLICKHVASYRVEVERFFQLVVFNYLIRNGDAHLKNFSLIRNDVYGDYTLTPAYDLLNTGLHFPEEQRTALPLFKDEFETPSFRANAFYAYDDFLELAKRLGLHERRFKRFMGTIVGKENEVAALIDRSALSKECKRLYKAGVADSIRALAYSFSGQS
jgi:serine/threonine-protein kinase HipA